MYVHNLADALLGELHHRLHFFGAEGVTFGGALHFDEAAAVVHDDVHVRLGFAVLTVFEVEQRCAAIDTDRDGGNLAVQRVLFEFAALEDLDVLIVDNDMNIITSKNFKYEEVKK